MLSTLFSVVVFLVVIGVVIFIHEFGHFIVAKMSGIKVEEFALGFGPKIFSKKRRDTNYVLKLFPIGGSVSLLGEEKRVKKNNSFSEKPFIIKVFVAIGGIVMNFVLSSLVFYMILIHLNFVYLGLPYYSGMHLLFGEQSKEYAYPPVVLEIKEGSGAEKAGIKKYWEIVKIDGEKIESVKEMQEVLANYSSETVNIGYVDEGGDPGEIQVEVSSEGKIGVFPAEDIEILRVEYTGIQRYFSGVLHSVNMVQANVFIIGKIFSTAISERDIGPVAESVSGPVGLLAITDTVLEFGGFWGVVELLGVISIALCITNIIPIPGLDGSHVLLLVVEKVRGKPLNDKIKGIIFGAGMILLFTLAFVVALKDIVQFGIWDWMKGLFS